MKKQKYTIDYGGLSGVIELDAGESIDELNSCVSNFMGSIREYIPHMLINEEGQINLDSTENKDNRAMPIPTEDNPKMYLPEAYYPSDLLFKAFQAYYRPGKTIDRGYLVIGNRYVYFSVKSDVLVSQFEVMSDVDDAVLALLYVLFNEYVDTRLNNRLGELFPKVSEDVYDILCEIMGGTMIKYLESKGYWELRKVVYNGGIDHGIIF